MSKYQNGKIYKIIDKTNNNVYVGSTCQTLEQRLTKHINSYKRYLNGESDYITSIKILQNGDYNIELIEIYPCETKKELCEREGYHIKISANCVNKNVSGRTRQEYRQANKDKIFEQLKQYYDKNKDKLSEYNKQYLKKNKERLLEYKAQYIANNKEKISNQQKQYREQKISCICGSEITLQHKLRHERTKKHIKFIEQQV
jgi:hypothetical protein